jgi:hypothetical protein
VAQHVESRHTKQNTSSMRDRIDNYDAYLRYARSHSMPVN